MIGILAKILGSGDVVKQGMNLIDDMVVTSEEEIAAKSKAKTDLLAAYQPFKLAQRYIALMFTAMFLFIMANGVVGALYGVIDMANVEAAKDFASSMWLGEIMLGIVGFYFGGGLAESVRKK
jgi:hypothetical protein|tara:strand:+ start:342 stop:707 length:366 start_codon:yes stop_codon:yes gene_type:complete